MKIITYEQIIKANEICLTQGCNEFSCKRCPYKDVESCSYALRLDTIRAMNEMLRIFRHQDEIIQRLNGDSMESIDPDWHEGI